LALFSTGSRQGPEPTPEAPVTALQPPERPGTSSADSRLDTGVTQPSGPAHRWGFGAFMLVEAVLLLSAVFLSAILAPPGATVGLTALLVGTIVPTALAAGTAVLITVLRGNGPMIDLRLRITLGDLRTGLRLGLFGIVITVVGAYAWTRIVGANDASSAINSLLDGGRMPVGAAVVMFVYVWLVGPICEEIIFRGLLWGAIERQQWGRGAPFALSTGIFAVSHLEPMRTALLLVIALPIGLARMRTGRLPASIVAHQVNNFLPALAMLLISVGVMAN
jgi:hypothetical protein